MWPLQLHFALLGLAMIADFGQTAEQSFTNPPPLPEKGMFLFTFCYGLGPNTTPTHVGGHEFLTTIVVMCRSHLPALLTQVLNF